MLMFRPTQELINQTGVHYCNGMKYLFEIAARLAVVVTEVFFRLCHERVRRNP